MMSCRTAIDRSASRVPTNRRDVDDQLSSRSEHAGKRDRIKMKRFAQNERAHHARGASDGDCVPEAKTPEIPYGVRTTPARMLVSPSTTSRTDSTRPGARGDRRLHLAPPVAH